MTEPSAETARRNQLVTDWLNARAAAEKHETIANQLAEMLIRELGVGGRHEVQPGVGVRIQAPARRFTADQARAVLSTDQLAAISQPVPNVTLAEKRLPGALVELCKVPGTRPSVREL